MDASTLIHDLSLKFDLKREREREGITDANVGICAFEQRACVCGMCARKHQGSSNRTTVIPASSSEYTCICPCNHRSLLPIILSHAISVISIGNLLLFCPQAQRRREDMRSGGSRTAEKRRMVAQHKGNNKTKDQMITASDSCAILFPLSLLQLKPGTTVRTAVSKCMMLAQDIASVRRRRR